LKVNRQSHRDEQAIDHHRNHQSDADSPALLLDPRDRDPTTTVVSTGGGFTQDSVGTGL
jgi:hypothetical protein